MQPTAVSRAIADSIKGGYGGISFEKGQWVGINTFQINNSVESQMHMRSMFFDRAFWVALGVARGWDSRKEPLDTMYNEIRNSKYYWHRLVDALDKNLSPEQFFLSLEGNEV